MFFTLRFICYCWMLVQGSVDGNLNGTNAPLHHEMECSAYREEVAKAYAPSHDAGDVNATLNDIGWLMSSNGSCMFVVRQLLSWAEHNQRCESVTGGRLAWLKDRFQMSMDECHRFGSTHCSNDTYLQDMFIGMYRRDHTSTCSQKYVWASHNGTCEQNMCTFVHAPAIKPVDVMNVELCATSAYHSAKPEREIIIISEGAASHHCPDNRQTAGGVQRMNGSSYIHIDEFLVDVHNETMENWMPHYYIINPWDCGNHSAVCEIVVNSTPTCPDPTTVVCPEPPPAATIPAEIKHTKGPEFSSLIPPSPASTTPDVIGGDGHTTEETGSSSLIWLWVMLALLALVLLLVVAFFGRKHLSSAGPSEASDAPPSPAGKPRSTSSRSAEASSGGNSASASSQAPIAIEEPASPALGVLPPPDAAPGYFPPAGPPALVPLP